MTNQEFLDAFYVLYDKVATAQSPGFKPEQIQIFASEAQELLVITGYSPQSNRLKEGFEESEKRAQDFGELIRSKTITPKPYDSTKNMDNGVFVDLPNVNIINTNVPNTYDLYDVFWFPIYEQVTGSFKNCEGKYEKINVYYINHAQYAALLADPFNKPQKSRVWRLRYQGHVHELITDGSFKIKSYHVRYIKKPMPIKLDGTFSLGAQVSELSDHMHREILRKTVDLALRASENTVRIQTEPRIIE